ncbi:uncharacterized protein BYT42DRAFT_568276 [Radiomyces spectabilis]|uniref:uncharacterized protein n=1 Tax=Radiomyces spectabilis TaxID=64574 RepID=UPI00221FD14F|nr:uncharacterized protein BYT42DRAFT_568276 [Radiomyces spectabilis]KAI8379269.1 hypothetical protein BYT42DRAFT_568276 [Radiomyces spectabilis]
MIRGPHSFCTEVVWTLKLGFSEFLGRFDLIVGEWGCVESVAITCSLGSLETY